jgi:uncharacterized membrane protein (DUF373 family)
MINQMVIRELFQNFSELPQHTQWVIGLVVGLIAVVFIAAITALLIVIDIHPAGVGGLLAFIAGIVALVISKRNASPPQEQAQTVSPYRW